MYGNIPQNDGLYRPITIVAPRGCIANPIFPAPTIARFAPGNVVADTLMRALAPAVPEQVSAGVANLKAVTFTGFAGEQQWVHIEIFEGSYGGRSAQDGMDSVDTLYANTRNNPIEDIESHVPLRVTRYELREDAVAAGRWRGGLNSIKEIAVPDRRQRSASRATATAHTPWGFQGGGDGRTSQLQLIRAGPAGGRAAVDAADGLRREGRPDPRRRRDRRRLRQGAASGRREAVRRGRAGRISHARSRGTRFRCRDRHGRKASTRCATTKLRAAG